MFLVFFQDWNYLIENSYHANIVRSKLSIMKDVFKDPNVHATSRSDFTINHNAQLFTHIPAIFYALHLVYEVITLKRKLEYNFTGLIFRFLFQEIKLNTLLWENNLHLLATVLLQLAW